MAQANVNAGVQGKIVGSISILLLLLILIYFLRFEIKPPEELDAPPYLSLVDFIPIERIKDYEDAG